MSGPKTSGHGGKETLCCLPVPSRPDVNFIATIRIRLGGAPRCCCTLIALVTTFASNAAGTLHEKLVFNRRVGVLAVWFAKLIPEGATVLDVGCGDGLVAAVLQSKRPDIEVQGIDVLPRDKTHMRVSMFDGTNIPFPDASFDVVMFSDVLHHTEDPTILQLQARRVSKRNILIKDHFRKGIAANARLRFMDWVGNSRFGVALPYNYWSDAQWQSAWQLIGLRPEQLITKLGLYPVPAKWLFEARLQFIALLSKADPTSQKS
jgi:SAM-dependent methyltransferase